MNMRRMLAVPSEDAFGGIEPVGPAGNPQGAGHPVGVPRRRRLPRHPNRHGHERAHGTRLVDEGLVIDDEPITTRTGGHAHVPATTISERLEG